MDGEPRPSRISENREEALSFLQNSMRNCDAMIAEIRAKDKASASLQTAYHQIRGLKDTIHFYTSLLSRRGNEQLNKLEKERLGHVEEDIRALYRFQGQTANFEPQKVEDAISRMRDVELEKNKQYSERVAAVRAACGDNALNTFSLNEGTEEEKMSQGVWQSLDPKVYEPGVNIIPIDVIIAVEQDIRAHSSHVFDIAFSDRKQGDLNWRIKDNLTVLEQLPIMPTEPQTV